MTKIRVNDVLLDEMMEEYEAEQMGDPSLPDHELLRYRKTIAEDANVDVENVRLDWCGPVDEYCIYINGRWSGYLDWSDFSGQSTSHREQDTLDRTKRHWVESSRPDYNV